MSVIHDCPPWRHCCACGQPVSERHPDCARCGYAWAFHEIRANGTRGGAEFIGPGGKQVTCPGYRPQEGGTDA